MSTGDQRSFDPNDEYMPSGGSVATGGVSVSFDNWLEYMAGGQAPTAKASGETTDWSEDELRGAFNQYTMGQGQHRVSKPINPFTFGVYRSEEEAEYPSTLPGIERKVGGQRIAPHPLGRQFRKAQEVYFAGIQNTQYYKQNPGIQEAIGPMIAERKMRGTLNAMNKQQRQNYISSLSGEEGSLAQRVHDDLLQRQQGGGKNIYEVRRKEREAANRAPEHQPNLERSAQFRESALRNLYTERAVDKVFHRAEVAQQRNEQARQLSSRTAMGQQREMINSLRQSGRVTGSRTLVVPRIQPRTPLIQSGVESKAYQFNTETRPNAPDGRGWTMDDRYVGDIRDRITAYNARAGENRSISLDSRTPIINQETGDSTLRLVYREGREERSYDLRLNRMTGAESFNDTLKPSGGIFATKRAYWDESGDQPKLAVQSARANLRDALFSSEGPVVGLMKRGGMYKNFDELKPQNLADIHAAVKLPDTGPQGQPLHLQDKRAMRQELSNYATQQRRQRVESEREAWREQNPGAALPAHLQRDSDPVYFGARGDEGHVYDIQTVAASGGTVYRDEESGEMMIHGTPNPKRLQMLGRHETLRQYDIAGRASSMNEMAFNLSDSPTPMQGYAHGVRTRMYDPATSEGARRVRADQYMYGRTNRYVLERGILEQNDLQVGDTFGFGREALAVQEGDRYRGGEHSSIPGVIGSDAGNYIQSRIEAINERDDGMMELVETRFTTDRNAKSHGLKAFEHEVSSADLRAEGIPDNIYGVMQMSGSKDMQERLAYLAMADVTMGGFDAERQSYLNDLVTQQHAAFGGSMEGFDPSGVAPMMRARAAFTDYLVRNQLVDDQYNQQAFGGGNISPEYRKYMYDWRDDSGEWRQGFATDYFRRTGAFKADNYETTLSRSEVERYLAPGSSLDDEKPEFIRHMRGDDTYERFANQFGQKVADDLSEVGPDGARRGRQVMQLLGQDPSGNYRVSMNDFSLDSFELMQHRPEMLTRSHVFREDEMRMLSRTNPTAYEEILARRDTGMTNRASEQLVMAAGIQSGQYGEGQSPFGVTDISDVNFAELRSQSLLEAMNRGEYLTDVEGNKAALRRLGEETGGGLLRYKGATFAGGQALANTMQIDPHTGTMVNTLGSSFVNAMLGNEDADEYLQKAIEQQQQLAGKAETIARARGQEVDVVGGAQVSDARVRPNEIVMHDEDFRRQIGGMQGDALMSAARAAGYEGSDEGAARKAIMERARSGNMQALHMMYPWTDPSASGMTFQMTLASEMQKREGMENFFVQRGKTVLNPAAVQAYSKDNDADAGMTMLMLHKQGQVSSPEAILDQARRASGAERQKALEKALRQPLEMLQKGREKSVTSVAAMEGMMTESQGFKAAMGPLYRMGQTESSALMEERLAQSNLSPDQQAQIRSAVGKRGSLPYQSALDLEDDPDVATNLLAQYRLQATQPTLEATTGRSTAGTLFDPARAGEEGYQGTVLPGGFAKSLSSAEGYAHFQASKLITQFMGRDNYLNMAGKDMAGVDPDTWMSNPDNVEGLIREQAMNLLPMGMATDEGKVAQMKGLLGEIHGQYSQLSPEQQARFVVGGGKKGSVLTDQQYEGGAPFSFTSDWERRFLDVTGSSTMSEYFFGRNVAGEDLPAEQRAPAAMQAQSLGAYRSALKKNYLKEGESAPEGFLSDEDERGKYYYNNLDPQGRIKDDRAFLGNRQEINQMAAIRRNLVDVLKPSRSAVEGGDVEGGMAAIAQRAQLASEFAPNAMAYTRMVNSQFMAQEAPPAAPADIGPPPASRPAPEDFAVRPVAMPSGDFDQSAGFDRVAAQAGDTPSLGGEGPIKIPWSQQNIAEGSGAFGGKSEIIAQQPSGGTVAAQPQRHRIPVEMAENVRSRQAFRPRSRTQSQGVPEGMSAITRFAEDERGSFSYQEMVPTELLMGQNGQDAWLADRSGTGGGGVVGQQSVDQSQNTYNIEGNVAAPFVSKGDVSRLRGQTRFLRNFGSIFQGEGTAEERWGSVPTSVQRIVQQQYNAMSKTMGALEEREEMRARGMPIPRSGAEREYAQYIRDYGNEGQEIQQLLGRDMSFINENLGSEEAIKAIQQATQAQSGTGKAYEYLMSNMDMFQSGEDGAPSLFARMQGEWAAGENLTSPESRQAAYRVQKMQKALKTLAKSDGGALTAGAAGDMATIARQSLEEAGLTEDMQGQIMQSAETLDQLGVSGMSPYQAQMEQQKMQERAARDAERERQRALRQAPGASIQQMATLRGNMPYMANMFQGAGLQSSQQGDLGNISKNVVELTNSLKDFSKVTRENIEDAQEFVKVGGEFNKTLSAIVEEADALGGVDQLSEEKRSALDRAGMGGMGIQEMRADIMSREGMMGQVTELMTRMQREGVTGASAEERSAERWSAFMQGGSSGRQRRARMMSQGKFEDDEGDALTRISDMFGGRGLEAASGAARGMTRAFSPHTLFQMRAIHGMFVDPYADLSERYSQQQNAIGMVGARRAGGYSDMMSGNVGQRRRREAVSQLIDRDIGETTYQAYGGFLSRAYESSGEMRGLMGSLGGIFAPAAGAGLMAGFMTGNPLIGAGVGLGAAAVGTVGWATDPSRVKGAQRHAQEFGKAEQGFGFMNLEFGIGAERQAEIDRAKLAQPAYEALGAAYRRGDITAQQAVTSQVLSDPTGTGSGAARRQGSGSLLAQRLGIDATDMAATTYADLVGAGGSAVETERLARMFGKEQDVEWAREQLRRVGAGTDAEGNFDQDALTSMLQSKSMFTRHGAGRVLSNTQVDDIERLTAAGLSPEMMANLSYGIAETQGVSRYDDSAMDASLMGGVQWFSQLAANPEQFKSVFGTEDIGLGYEQAMLGIGAANTMNASREMAGRGLIDGSTLIGESMFKGAGSARRLEQYTQLDTGFTQAMMGNRLMSDYLGGAAERNRDMFMGGNVAGAFAQQQRTVELAGTFGNYVGQGTMGMPAATEFMGAMEGLGERDYRFMQNIMGGNVYSLQDAGNAIGDARYVTMDKQGRNVYETGMSAATAGYVQQWAQDNGYGEILAETGMNLEGMGTRDLEKRAREINIGARDTEYQWNQSMRQAGLSLEFGGTRAQDVKMDSQGFLPVEINDKSFDKMKQMFEELGFGGFNVGDGRTLGQLQDAGIRRQQEQMELGISQKSAQIDISQQQRDMQRRHFYEDFGAQERQLTYNLGYQRESMNIQRGREVKQQGWQTEDMAFSRNQSELSFAWGQEDFSRNIRYARGRERRDLMRQQERSVVQFAMDQGQRDRQEARHGTQVQWSSQDWGREVENFQQREQFQREDMERNRRQFEEKWALESQLFDMQQESNKLSLEHSKQELEDMKQRHLLTRQNELMQAAQQERAAQYNYQNAVELQMIADATNAINMAQRDAQAYVKMMVETGQIAQVGLDRIGKSAQNLASNSGAAVQNIGGISTALNNMFSQISAQLGLARSNAAAAAKSQPSMQQRANQWETRYGFADGGFTGHGARDEVAGSVHKGEWVVPQQGALVIRNDRSEDYMGQMVRLLQQIVDMGPGRVDAKIYTNASEINTSDLRVSDRAYGYIS